MKQREITKDNWLCKLEEVVIEGPEVEIIKKIKKARSKDEEVVRIVEEMKKAKVKAIQGEEQQIKGDLVLKKGKIYVLKDEELRAEIIWLHHDVPAVGHGGKQKTVELATRNYWWPEVIREVGRYVEGCDLCQWMKNRIEEIAEKIAEKLKLGEVQKNLGHIFQQTLLLSY